MKKIILLVGCCIGCSVDAFSQTPSSSITFQERVFDFGTILEKNGKVSHRFVFENKGKTPVTIDDIYSNCGCIGKVISSKETKAGEKGEVLITFNPDYKSGFFSKEIIVYSNNKQHYIRIWVQGKVTPAEHPIENDYPYNFGDGLYLRLKVMAFGYMKPGETKQMELHYANNTAKEMSVEFSQVGTLSGLKFTSPGKVAAKAKGVVKVSFTMPMKTTEDVLIQLQPKVNNKKLKETLDIKVLNIKKLTK